MHKHGAKIQLWDNLKDVRQAEAESEAAGGVDYSLPLAGGVAEIERSEIEPGESATSPCTCAHFGRMISRATCGSSPGVPCGSSSRAARIQGSAGAKGRVDAWDRRNAKNAQWSGTADVTAPYCDDASIVSPTASCSTPRATFRRVKQSVQRAQSGSRGRHVIRIPAARVKTAEHDDWGEANPVETGLRTVAKRSSVSGSEGGGRAMAPLDGCSPRSLARIAKGPHTPWAEPWWNAGRRARPIAEGRRKPLSVARRARSVREYTCVCRRSASLIFVIARSESDEAIQL